MNTKTWADEIEAKYKDEVIPLLDEMLERQKEQIFILSSYKTTLKDLLEEKRTIDKSSKHDHKEN